MGDGGAAAFILELEVAGGGVDRLAVYRGEDLSTLVEAYGDLRSLTPSGRAELRKVLDDNIRIVTEEDKEEIERDEGAPLSRPPSEYDEPGDYDAEISGEELLVEELS